MSSKKEDLRFLLKKARHASLFAASAMDSDEISRLIELSEEVGDGKSQVNALLYAASIYINQNSIEEAEGLIARIRDIADAAGDLATLSLAKALRANILISVGKVEEAYEILDQAVCMAEESGNHKIKAEVITYLARAAYVLGNYDEAERLAREARVLSISTGNRTSKLFATKHLASVVHHTSRFDEAWRYLEEALSYADKAEFRFVQPSLYEGLGCISGNMGFHERSLEYLKKSRIIAGEVGHHRTKVMATATLVVILSEMENQKDAESELRELKRLVNKHYPNIFNFVVAYSYDTEIRVLLSAGEFDRALELSRDLAEKGEESDIFLAEAWGTLGMGNSLLGLKRYDEALEYLKQAYEFAKDYEDKGLIMISLYSLYKAFKTSGRNADAHQVLEEALKIVTGIATKISDKEYRSVYLEKGFTSRLIVEAGRAEGMGNSIDEILEYSE